MKVLVAVGSKYGATREIAQAIATVISDFGCEAECLDAKDVETVEPYDAFVIGSALYGGFWRRDASELVHSHVDELRGKPVWLFSSGPVGLPPRPAEAVGEGESLAEVVQAKGHGAFSGCLNSERLNAGERAIIRGLKASVGDYREWGLVKNWAREIGAELSKAKAESTEGQPAQADA
ncbi:MAG: flavodoxin domain-containing protein [Demequinaceae bacterium]|nr:flavodoxin domain-containing protein [Demequinaceae bacterium]